MSTIAKRKLAKKTAAPDLRRIDISLLAKNLGKALLVLVATGSITSIAVIAPALPAALSELADLFDKTPRFKRNQAFRRLRQQRLIEMNERNGVTTISLTKKGKRHILTFELESMRLAKPNSWDTKWRIVTFDIPEQFHKARRALRMKMRELGFYPLQKSVFIHPYPCRDEIDFIADFFGVGRYLNYIEATYIDDTDYLKQHFGLR